MLEEKIELCKDVGRIVKVQIGDKDYCVYRNKGYQVCPYFKALGGNSLNNGLCEYEVKNENKTDRK